MSHFFQPMCLRCCPLAKALSYFHEFEAVRAERSLHVKKRGLCRSSYASGSQSQLKKDSCEVNLLHSTSLLEAREKFTNLQVILTMHLLYLATLFVAVAAAPPTAASTKECPDWDLGGIWGKVSGKKHANNVTATS